jgi:hypothetical protein
MIKDWSTEPLFWPIMNFDDQNPQSASPETPHHVILSEAKNLRHRCNNPSWTQILRFAQDDMQQVY